MHESPATSLSNARLCAQRKILRSVNKRKSRLRKQPSSGPNLACHPLPASWLPPRRRALQQNNQHNGAGCGVVLNSKNIAMRMREHPSRTESAAALDEVAITDLLRSGN